MDTSSATRRGRNERVYRCAWARSDPTALGSGESTGLFSLSSDGGGGEGRGEESRFYWISPLPNPLPTRSSQGEGDRRTAFQCFIQWQCTLALRFSRVEGIGHRSVVYPADSLADLFQRARSAFRLAGWQPHSTPVLCFLALLCAAPLYAD